MQQEIKSMDSQVVSMGFEERAERKGMDSGQGVLVAKVKKSMH